MLKSLHKCKEKMLKESSGNEKIVLESLFHNPYVKISDVASMCNIHVSTAGRLVDNLVERRILREITGNKRNRLFVNDEIMNIIDQYWLLFRSKMVRWPGIEPEYLPWQGRSLTASSPSQHARD